MFLKLNNQSLKVKVKVKIRKPKSKNMKGIVGTYPMVGLKCSPGKLHASVKVDLQAYTFFMLKHVFPVTISLMSYIYMRVLHGKILGKQVVNFLALPFL